MRKIISSIFIILAIVLGAIFYSKIEFPKVLEDYFKADYYQQFGPLVISIELLIAGIYLFIKHPKDNFALALFGFTALLDSLFNLIGLFSSLVSIYAMALFCSLIILRYFIDRNHCRNVSANGLSHALVFS